MSRESRCADVIAETLVHSGVSHVFGHPGGEVIDLIDALEHHGISFVLTGHESAAAFIAGAIGRLTGTPGVALATLGPGACNLTLGVACAYLDRDPLLAFSARTSTARERVSNKQNLALNALFEPITKRSIALDGTATADQVQAAVGLARTPPRGPVYLSLPMDVAVQPDRANGAGSSTIFETPSVLETLGVSEPRPFDAILNALNHARRPIGVVGIALDPERDPASVRRFLQNTEIPFVSLPQAKGVADECAETFLGTVAPGAGETPIDQWLEQSDCLLGIGFDPVESSQGWHYDRPFYSIATYPVGYGEFVPTEEYVGNVGAFLDELGASYHSASVWTRAEVNDVRARVAAALVPPAEQSSKGLAPYHVMRALHTAAPHDSILTCDVGAHKMLAAQMWQARTPCSFLVSNGLSAMGYGIPSALAASLCKPAQPVIAIVGDGGFAMMVQELETARRMEVKPLIVVLCDQALAVIKVAQTLHGIPFRGVNFSRVDWARVAHGFGVNSFFATTLAQVRDAVESWSRDRELTVLAVQIDDALYAGLSY